MARTTSTDQSRVAAAIIVSPAPQPMPVGGAIEDLAGEQHAERADLDQPSRSPRKGTAIRATQMKSVFWMNAAVGAVAMARPLKKSTNGTLPPTIAITRRPARRRPSRAASFASRTEGQREADKDDRRDAVLGGRVDRGIGHELDAERIEIDGQAADRGRAECEDDAALGRSGLERSLLELLCCSVLLWLSFVESMAKSRMLAPPRGRRSGARCRPPR